MARQDWYGGIRWVDEYSGIPASVVLRVVREAAEAMDRMRAPPKPPRPSRRVGG